MPISARFARDVLWPFSMWPKLCSAEAMKFIALLIAMAIVCMLVVKRAQPSQVAEAMREADAVVQPVSSAPATPQPSAPAQNSTGLRRPIDRTRSVLNQVKQRNGSNEF